jgi:hypothetical protein
MSYVFGDLYHIAGRVKEIDPALFIDYDQQKKKYNVKRTKQNGQAHHIMSVDRLDERILTNLRKYDLQRRGVEDLIRELEHSEDIAERRRAKQIRDTIEDITLDKFNQLIGIPQFSLGHWEGAH